MGERVDIRQLRHLRTDSVVTQVDVFTEGTGVISNKCVDMRTCPESERISDAWWVKAGGPQSGSVVAT